MLFPSLDNDVRHVLSYFSTCIQVHVTQGVQLEVGFCTGGSGGGDRRKVGFDCNQEQE